MGYVLDTKKLIKIFIFFQTVNDIFLKINCFYILVVKLQKKKHQMTPSNIFFRFRWFHEK